MSNLIINWRFGRWFFQVTRPSDWGRTVDGAVQLKRYPTRRIQPEPWVSFYQGGRYAILLAVLIVALIWWLA